MDASRFDDVVRSLSNAPSRRKVLTGFVAATLGLGLPGITSAGNRKKRKKKPKLNDSGCVNVGGKCRGKDSLCCSGICQGKKPKKGKKDKSRCVAHDVGNCPPGQNACSNPPGVGCSRGGDEPGAVCFTTTGDAPYCTSGDDFGPDCSKDAECISDCGIGAACVKCGIGTVIGKCKGLDVSCGIG
jgi:hypothetical protein